MQDKQNLNIPINFQEEAGTDFYFQGFAKGMDSARQDLIQSGLVSKEEIGEFAEFDPEVEDFSELNAEYKKEAFAEGLTEGAIFICIRYVGKGMITFKQAVDYLEMPEETFRKYFDQTLKTFGYDPEEYL